MDQFAKTILLFISAILGVESIPNQTNDWEILQAWEKMESGYYIFSAKNYDIANRCKQNPSYYIKFPAVIHSSTKIIFNDTILAITSSPDFKHTKGFYGIIVIPCHQLSQQKGVLRWEVISYTQYFTRFQYFPQISQGYPFHNFFNETFHGIAAGILLVHCALCLILFQGKITPAKIKALFFSNFFSSIYFIGTIAGFFGLNISMLTAHKMADSGGWLGLLFFYRFLYLEQLLPRWMFTIYQISIWLALGIILASTTGDSVQLGTTIPFLFTIIINGYAMLKIVRDGMVESQKYLLRFIGLFLAFIGYANDIFVVVGMLDFVPILPIGIVGSYFFILLSVDEKINKTYTERDNLKILAQKLEESNENLKATQNELVKSEKMAALGRAVGRVAHELNTPIYGIRNSSQLMKKLTEKILVVLDSNEKDSIKDQLVKYRGNLEKMLNVILVSASRAAELVANFKKISIDQINPRKKDFKLLGYIRESVVGMEHTLHRKKIAVNYEGDDPALFHDPSLFHQITQNLIANIDVYAYKDGGEIDIFVREGENDIEIRFTDYGAGIPQENLSKIFDPFFTTGGGLGGTGLGLNIVYRIVTSQLGGKIVCHSKPGEGSTFIVTIPKHLLIKQS